MDKHRNGLMPAQMHRAASKLYSCFTRVNYNYDKHRRVKFVNFEPPSHFSICYVGRTSNFMIYK